MSTPQLPSSFRPTSDPPRPGDIQPSSRLPFPKNNPLPRRSNATPAGLAKPSAKVRRIRARKLPDTTI